MSIQLNTYRKRKAAGSVTLATRGEAHVATLRYFDETTGAQDRAEEVSLSIPRLQTMLAELKENMAQLEELIADLEEADETPRVPRTRDGR